MLTVLATKWNSLPRPVRDFLESVLTSGILGAAVGLNGYLNDPNVQVVTAVGVVLKGFLDAAIAAARRGLAVPK